MVDTTNEKNTRAQRLMHERALRASAGGQRILPFDDLETRGEGTHKMDGGEAVACMFADEFRVLEMRREAR